MLWAMKTTLFRISTGLLALALVLGGVFDLLRAPAVTQTLAALGYPAYLASILGFWKVLGAAAITAPGLARLKEWAYAGVAFELTGAAASHAFAGDPPGKILVPVVLLAFAALSWALRPASRRIGELFDAPVPAAATRAHAGMA